MKKLEEFREEIQKHNKDHPELKGCIYPNCSNKIYPTWDNDVLCFEHMMLFEWWFYEEDGWKYCPETWDAFTGEKLRKPKGSDKDMIAYRKRYCDWIASLSESDYIGILKHQIGDDEELRKFWRCQCCGFVFYSEVFICSKCGSDQIIRRNEN